MKNNKIFKFTLFFLIAIISMLSITNIIKADDFYWKNNELVETTVWNNVTQQYEKVKQMDSLKEYKSIVEQVTSIDKNSGTIVPSVKIKIEVKLPGESEYKVLAKEHSLDNMYFKQSSAYKNFRQDFLNKLNMQQSNYQALISGENQIYQKNVEIMTELDTLKDFTFPVGTKIRLTDLSDPGKGVNGSKVNINKRNWQIMSYDLTKKRHHEENKGHVLKGGNFLKEFTNGEGRVLEFETVNPGYLFIYLNVSNTSKATVEEHGPGGSWNTVPFNSYSDDGTWRTRGGENITNYSENRKYEPKVNDWYYVHFPIKFDNIDTSNIKVPNVPYNSYVEGNNGSKEYPRLEVREVLPNGQTGKIINDKNCEHYGNYNLCGFVEEGKTYEITAYAQRDKLLDQPKDHSVKEFTLDMNLGAGFNLVNNQLVFNRYDKLNAFGHSDNISSIKMKLDEIIEYKNNKFNSVVKSDIDNRNVDLNRRLAERKTIDNGTTMIFKEIITMPKKGGDNGSFYTKPNMWDKDKNGYPAITIQNWITFKDGATREDVKKVNKFSQDDWGKTILWLKPNDEQVDNRVRIPHITPESPNKPPTETPIKPNPENTGLCTTIKSKDNTFTATIELERIKGNGDKLIQPEIKVLIYKNTDKPIETIATLKPGSGKELNKPGDKIIYEVKGIEIKDNDEVRIEAKIDHKDLNLENNWDNVCFTKKPNSPDNSIIIEKLIPFDPKKPINPNNPTHPKEVPSNKHMCNQIEASTNYTAIIKVKREILHGHKLVKPNIDVWVKDSIDGNWNKRNAKLISRKNTLENEGDIIYYSLENVQSDTGYLAIKTELLHEDINPDNNIDEACFDSSLNFSVEQFTVVPKNHLKSKTGCEYIDMNFDVTFEIDNLNAFDSTKEYIPIAIHKYVDGVVKEKVYEEKILFNNRNKINIRKTFKDYICEAGRVQYIVGINGVDSSFNHNIRTKKEIIKTGNNPYEDNILITDVIIKRNDNTPPVKICKGVENSIDSTKYGEVRISWNQDFTNYWEERMHTAYYHQIKEEYECCKDWESYKDDKGRTRWECVEYGTCTYWVDDTDRTPYYSSWWRDILNEKRPPRKSNNKSFEELYKIRILYQDSNIVSKRGNNAWIDITNKKVKVHSGQWFDIIIEDLYAENRSRYYDEYNGPLAEWTNTWSPSSPWDLVKGPSEKTGERKWSEPYNKKYLDLDRDMYIIASLDNKNRSSSRIYKQEGIVDRSSHYQSNLPSSSNFTSGHVKQYRIPNSKNTQVNSSNWNSITTRKNIPYNASNTTYEIEVKNVPFKGYSQGYDPKHPGYKGELDFQYDKNGNLVVCNSNIYRTLMRTAVRAQIIIEDQAGIDTQIIGN